jgi:hypothetical protein
LGDDAAEDGGSMHGPVSRVLAGYVELAPVDRERDQRTVNRSSRVLELDKARGSHKREHLSDSVGHAIDEPATSCRRKA